MSNRISALAEDHELKNWLGTDEGIYILTGDSVITLSDADIEIKQFIIRAKSRNST